MTPKQRVEQAIVTLGYYTRTKARCAVAAQAGCASWAMVDEQCDAAAQWAGDLEALKPCKRAAYIERRHDEIIGRVSRRQQ